MKELSLRFHFGFNILFSNNTLVGLVVVMMIVVVVVVAAAAAAAVFVVVVVREVRENMFTFLIKILMVFLLIL